MNDWLEWLFDLRTIDVGRDAPLLLRWETPFQAWELFCFVLVALGWILLVYRREELSWFQRAILIGVRCLTVLTLVTTLSRPTLVWQKNRIEPSHVVLAVDRSLSMGEHDLYADPAVAEAIVRGAELSDIGELRSRSRLELIQRALLADGAASLHGLLQRQQVQLCAFAGTVETQGFFPTTESKPDLAEALARILPDGELTDVPRAVTELVEKAGGRRLAAIVLATDGRSTQTSGWEDAVSLARGRQVPVFAVPIGSPVPRFDVEMGLVRAKETVFKNDLVVVEAQLLAHGVEEPTPIDVHLIDESSGVVVAAERVVVNPSQPTVDVEFRVKAVEAGSIRYRAEAVATVPEESTANNAGAALVAVLDRRLRVLYVDGYPRYEYRYLKNALVREGTIELSVLLLEADEEFVQEGTDPIRRFPESPEELHRYDLVLFGDVDPRGGWLTPAQMTMLLDYVGNEGGGFGLVAGERWTPQRFLGTPLEKLIPVRIDLSFQGRYEVSLESGFAPRFTEDGWRSSIFRFVGGRAENERLLGRLPELYWFARTLGPKPGASVLVEHPTAGTPTGPAPLVVVGRYGAGKLFFQATDDTWRWRRHNGELLHDAYWVQVARELMRTTAATGGRRWSVRTDRRQYPYGAGIRVQLEVFDPQLLAELGDVQSLGASRTLPAQSGQGPEPRPQESQPAPKNHRPHEAVEPFEVYRIGPETAVFEGVWVAPRPGQYTLEPTGMAAAAGERRSSAVVQVDPPNLEMRRPEADLESLLRITESTGGRLIALDHLADAFAEIRDRSVQIPDDVAEPLWDSKLALGVFVTLLFMEWVARKAFGLL